MQSERFAVGLTPLPTAARVTKARSLVRWRLISIFLSAAILVGFWYFFGRELPRNTLIVIIAISAVSTLFWVTTAIIGLRNAKRDLASIPEGVAFYLDHRGVEFAWPTQVRVPWADVTALKLGGRHLGRGHAVVLEAGGKEVAKVPLSFLDATPDVIDSAARAHSLGRIPLTVTALDRVL